jgi:FKBP-type peptidyl-prolyl cis-trans isomerase
MPVCCLLASLVWGSSLCRAAENDVKTTASGLKYEVLTAGKPGTEPHPGDKVKVNYVGRLTDGKQFDASALHGGPFEFELGAGEVIPGWDEMLGLMTVGSKVRATLPAKLAYGDQGAPPDIAPGATLVFEMELVGVTPGEPLPTFVAGTPAHQQTTASGLKWEALKDGAGPQPTKADGVTVKWALWTTDGKLLASTRTVGVTISGLLPNLHFGPAKLAFLPEAVGLMQAGGHYRFEVPAALAWGQHAMGEVLPAGSTTVWELDLVKINAVPAFAKTADGKGHTTASGLTYEVLKEGAGVKPEATDEVEVNYTGWLDDGTVFDSSHARGESTSFPLDRVIAGWTEGLQLMSPGASYRLTIPAALAYRNSPPPGSPIPPGATLIFQVDLIAVKRGGQ